jgi:hypothetical protein
MVCEMAVRGPGFGARPGTAYCALSQSQMGADRLRLAVNCASKLVAGVRRIAPELRPVTLAVAVCTAAAYLDVVLPHEAHDMADFYGHVIAAVLDTSDRGNPVPRLLDLRFGEPMAVKETQTICRYLDERWPFPHMFSIASPRPDSRAPACKSL